eukprot:Hpha_TRINITY_DN25939_c0_g1::TRINITY_DN25939_c0_g1_i1::g.185350::m.185350
MPPSGKSEGEKRGGGDRSAAGWRSEADRRVSDRPGDPRRTPPDPTVPSAPGRSGAQKRASSLPPGYVEATLVIGDDPGGFGIKVSTELRITRIKDDSAALRCGFQRYVGYTIVAVNRKKVNNFEHLATLIQTGDYLTFVMQPDGPKEKDGKRRRTSSQSRGEDNPTPPRAAPEKPKAKDAAPRRVGGEVTQEEGVRRDAEERKPVKPRPRRRRADEMVDGLEEEEEVVDVPKVDVPKPQVAPAKKRPQRRRADGEPDSEVKGKIKGWTTDRTRNKKPAGPRTRSRDQRLKLKPALSPKKTAPPPPQPVPPAAEMKQPPASGASATSAASSSTVRSAPEAAAKVTAPAVSAVPQKSPSVRASPVREEGKAEAAASPVKSEKMEETSPQDDADEVGEKGGDDDGE